MTSSSRPGSPVPSAATAPSSTRHSTGRPSPVRTFTARKGARHADRCRAGCQPAGPAAAAVAAGPAGRPLSCRGRYGRLVPGPLPGPVIRAAAAHADHRRAAAHERAGDQPGVGHGHRRLRGRHVLAVQVAQHLPQGRMLLVYGLLLVIGSVLAAVAADPAMFIAGHVLQGLCTSLLLIAAAPPLFLGYPAARLRWSAMIMNMCLFGAVTAGPLIGGVQASFHARQPLFW